MQDLDVLGFKFLILILNFLKIKTCIRAERIGLSFIITYVCKDVDFCIRSEWRKCVSGERCLNFIVFINEKKSCEVEVE